MNNKPLVPLLFGILLFSLLTNTTAQVSNSLAEEKSPRDIMIEADMQINLVLMGDTWLEEDKAEITKRLLQSYTPMISSKKEPAGVKYSYKYNFRSESKQVSDEVFKFIDSIGVETTVPIIIENWMFVQQPQLAKEKLVYKLIDAYRVEERLATLDQEKGYTIYFLKPTRQQLGYLHTYGAFTTDPDTNRPFVQEGMMGFGGKHRFYFIDLTAGPWIYPFIQTAETQFFRALHENINDLENQEQYYDLVAGYVNDAITLLFTPSYLYSPLYKLNYRMQVFVIDMTAGRVFHDVAETYIKRDAIEQAFVKLVPYARWESEITGQSFDSLPRELQRAVLRSLSFYAGGDKATLVKSSEFIMEIRNWVKETLSEEELRIQEEEAKTTVFVPIVLFVFDTDAYVDTVPVVGAALPDPMDKTVPWGAIVAANKHSLDFGTGLSALAIHEMGHVLGLRHPHDGYSESKGEFLNWFFDWSYTPMTYASPSTLGCGLPGERCGLIVSEFGAFNLDAMDRGLVLSLLDQVQLNLYSSLLKIERKGYDQANLPPDIKSKLSSIDTDVQNSIELFKEMNYFNFTSFESTSKTSDTMDDAFDFALRAFTDSQSLLEESERLQTFVLKSPIFTEAMLEISELSFIDDNGVESDTHEIFEPVLIKSMVSNKVAENVNFTAIIQIRDSDGFPLSISVLDLSVSPSEEVEPSLSWTFDRTGEFSIEVFLWTDLEDPVPLSPVQQASITMVR